MTIYSLTNATRASGFTVLELLTTLALATVLIGVGVPALAALMRQAEAADAAQAIYRSIQTARAEAITRQQVLTLCGSNDGTQCSKVWTKAVLVFADKNENNESDPGELVWQETLDLREATVTTRLAWGKAYTRVNPNGSVTLQGSMIHCQAGRAESARRITWNRGGRPYFGRDTDDDGIVENRDGSTIAC